MLCDFMSTHLAICKTEAACEYAYRMFTRSSDDDFFECITAAELSKMIYYWRTYVANTITTYK